MEWVFSGTQHTPRTHTGGGRREWTQCRGLLVIFILNLPPTFLLLITETFYFSLGVLCYGWGAKSKQRSKIAVFEGGTSIWPKISGKRDIPTNLSSCRKTRCIDLSYGVRIGADVSFVLSQFTCLTTHGRMALGSQLPCLHRMQRGIYRKVQKKHKWKNTDNTQNTLIKCHKL